MQRIDIHTKVIPKCIVRQSRIQNKRIDRVLHCYLNYTATYHHIHCSSVYINYKEVRSEMRLSPTQQPSLHASLSRTDAA